jgi:arginase
VERTRSAWTVLGAPLDSSGAARGEQRAPAALRAAGLVGTLGTDDAGDAPSLLDDPARDPATGLIGFAGLVTASRTIRQRVTSLLAAGARPLVVGGDCTILLGIAAALRDRHTRVGLWFVDGHADFYNGQTSPTGEGADMELAILTGRGLAGLVDLADPPLILPGDVALLGHRRPEQGSEVAEELGFLPPELFHLDATTITRRGPAQVGREVEQRIADRVDHAWLHLDLDALDERALPAVTYPQANGLDWDAATALLRPLAGSPGLIGMSVADFNPDLDPQGRYAARVVELLAAVLRGTADRS